MKINLDRYLNLRTLKLEDRNRLERYRKHCEVQVLAYREKIEKVKEILKTASENIK